jgi:hypothetical protein
MGAAKQKVKIAKMDVHRYGDCKHASILQVNAPWLIGIDQARLLAAPQPFDLILLGCDFGDPAVAFQEFDSVFGTADTRTYILPARFLAAGWAVE